MNMKALLAWLRAEHDEEAQEVVVRAYRTRRTTRRVAALFGCTPTEWARLLWAHPPLRRARGQALRHAGRGEMPALRRRPEDFETRVRGGFVKARRVVSEPGAIIEVTEIELSDEGRRALTTGTPRLGKVK